MDIPAGTILARAKREGWTREIQNAKALAKCDDTSTAVTPFAAVSASIQHRGEKHIHRMANIVERTLPHIEAMEPGAILDRVGDIDTLDKIGRRTFKLDDNAAGGGIELLQILSDQRQRKPEQAALNLVRTRPEKREQIVCPRQSFAINRCNQRSHATKQSRVD
jgi:hypothetical protein